MNNKEEKRNDFRSNIYKWELSIPPWLLVLVAITIALVLFSFSANASEYQVTALSHIREVNGQTDYCTISYNSSDLSAVNVFFDSYVDTDATMYIYWFDENVDVTVNRFEYSEYDGEEWTRIDYTYTYNTSNLANHVQLSDGRTVYYFDFYFYRGGFSNEKFTVLMNGDLYVREAGLDLDELFELILVEGMEPAVKYEEPEPEINIYNLPEDESYKLTGFKADNDINATWTGVTDSALITEDKYVSVIFAYASKEYPGLSDGAQVYSTLFSLSDLQFFIDWNEVQSVDESQYLLYMRVYPIGVSANGSYYRGDDTTVYYNIDGSVSSNSANKNTFDSIYNDITHGGSGSQSGTEYLSDFYLRNVVLKPGLINSKDVIQWNGCTNNTEYLTIPDSDTLVICTVVLYDSNFDYVVEYYDSTTIGSGSLVVDWKSLSEKYSESEYYWAGEVRLTPSYSIDNKLHIGQQTVINVLEESVKNEGIDSDGNFVVNDVTDSNRNNANQDSVLDNAADFLNDTESMAKYTGAFFGFLSNLVSLMGSFPDMVAAVFSFMPAIYINAISVMFVVVLVCRVLGR